MTGLPDLTADPRALHVCKRLVPVPVAFALADGVCETLEGPVHYQKGDALLTGVQGERYPRSGAICSWPHTCPCRRRRWARMGFI